MCSKSSNSTTRDEQCTKRTHSTRNIDAHPTRPGYILLHPSPLKFSQQQQQATRLRAVLAIVSSQRFGSFAHVALLEHRWWPCQIQALSQKLPGGGPGQWRQVGRCIPKSAQFWAKNSHFSPKTALVRVQNSQTKANGCYTTRAA